MEERPHERRLPHGAEAVAVAGFDRVCRLRGQEFGALRVGH